MNMETIIACLTPPGKAAIATLGVRGPKAWDITCQLFQPRKGSLPDAPDAGRFWFGRLGGDEVILAVKQCTPAPHLEIHCHGGIEVVRMIEELYVECGAVLVPWQQFLDDPTKLIEQLVQAPTTRTAAILLDQANGAWETRMRQMQAAEPAEFKRKLQRLKELIPLGEHLVESWKIVIAGAPNVGKSSLMNALAGFTRSVVAPIPGTTRDVVTTPIAIDGWPIELTDTAGIHETSSPLERQGIERAHRAEREADLRFWLLDGSMEPAFPEDVDRWILVINKTDLPAAWDWSLTPRASRISARTQAGLVELCEMISRRLVPQPPGPGEAVPCLPEHVQWVSNEAPG